jgi:hypothetical protein
MKQKITSALFSIAVISTWATGAAYRGLAQQSAQPTFPSAAEATQALFQAVQGNNEETIANILGGPTELTSSPDKGQDKADRELFVQKYQEMHRVGFEPDGSATLYIGAENWPFPIPLVKKGGAWQFDSDAGQKEVLFRRIGENELTAIAGCHEFATADKQDRAKPNSASGTPGDSMLFNGYYFRVLSTRQGAVLIAYPAEYRSSGVMTFVVTGNHVVYEKDLGPDTPAVAKAMTAFHKDSTWRAAGE